MTIQFAVYVAPDTAGSGNVPQVTGLASSSALSNAGRGRVPYVIGSASQVNFGVVVAAPGNQTSGNVPAVHGLAVGSVGATAIGHVPVVSGYAAPGVVEYGFVPPIRALASSIADALAYETVPIVSSYSASRVPLRPSIALGYGAVPFMSGAGAGTAFYPGDQDALIPIVHAMAATQAGAAGLARAPSVFGTALQVPALGNYALLVQSAGYLAAGSLATAPTWLLADTFVLSDDIDAKTIQALYDLFSMSDTYAARLHALQRLSDNATFSDIVNVLYRSGLLDRFIASDVLTGTARITLLLSDAATFSDTLSSKSQLLLALRDAFYATATISTGEDTYTAWVMTPETAAVRSYSNWPFNSFAMLNGQFIAAGPQGVYQIGGTTDMGQLINARVRTGLQDFGTRRLKRIDRTYVGYTSDGTLCMRVCATTATGTKTEYTYKMVPQTADAAREGRIGIGRGTRSVYFSFELCNDLDSSHFELYDITVLPMVLTGRVI